MNEKFVAQLIAELIDQQGAALGVLVAALTQRVDPTKLALDLQRYIAAAKLTGDLGSTGEKIARHAMAMADAESALQTKARH